ncbi:carboxylesterase family protein [Oceanicaulis alexandrii]|uniref:carboxylesterase/lipase family protein n=1 Tax=Oceanicaulis alexandrii TaxID=153233 RepID=UPI0035CE8E83
MRLGLKLAAIMSALFVVSACTSVEPAPEPHPDTQRLLSSGPVVGFLSENGAPTWLGLPYAQSTSGDNRWRAPEPTPSRTGLLEALQHPEPCPQIVNRLSTETTGLPVGALYGSEDCLKLDVYAPASAESGADGLPVMMWIHGGSNTWGYASQYDGSKLAQEQDVVVVVVQYRLGPLGFFAHPDIDEGQGANFALLDQVAALNWIQAEISQFGGDPDNVTIFGESAGGQNVAALLASPLASGLFHRAIVQSGFFDSVPLDEARNGDVNSAIPAADRMVEAQGNPDLRALSLQTVFDAYNLGDPRAELPRVIADGVSLPRAGLASAFDSPETFNAVPVITGTNRDEMKLFNALNDDLTRRRFGVLISIRDRAYYDRLSHYQSRLWRILAVDQAAERMQSAGHDQVWAYRFDWDEGGRLLTMNLSEIFGAAHAMEIPFVFNHFDFFGQLDRALFNRSNEDRRDALAASMGAYWANFARDGDPGAAGGPDWPRWSSDAELMRFDAPSPELIEGADSLSALLSDLGSDPALSAAQICRAAQALSNWRDELEDQILSQTDCAA